MTTVHMRPLAERDYGLDIAPDPSPWPYDGGARREPVTDPNWNDRVIRRVGWRDCMHCCRPFFSPDVVRVRLHADCNEVDKHLL